MSSLAVNTPRSSEPLESLEGTAPRERCYVCFRPLAACHCDAIPRIENRTPVLLVQHRRESFHPFNTARIVRHGLVNSELVVDQNQRLAARIDLRPGAVLLFPGSQARRLDELSPAERPTQLVVVDGTWHQVKTVLRHVPALRQLPQYCLTPTQPSNFRIRREPNEQALSTVEAVVAALRILEPETTGLEQLLTVFNLMIDRQLAQPRPVAGRRRLRRPRRTGPFIPPVLIDQPERIVITYCEAEGAPRGVRREEQRPRYLAAERLVTGERFEAAVQGEPSLTDTLLAHFELPRDCFAAAPTVDEVRAAWRDFLRPGDVVVVYGFGTQRLLREFSPPQTEFLVLKSIPFQPDRRFASLDHLVSELGLPVPAVAHAGRAGRRVANAKALVAYLRALRESSSTVSARLVPSDGRVAAPFPAGCADDAVGRSGRDAEEPRG